MKRRFSLIVALLLAATLVTAAFAGCADSGDEPETIRFVDGQWDTQTFLTHVAAFIVEHGYGYNTTIETASNVVGLKAIELGEIDVHMEVANISLREPHQALIATGLGEDLGVPFTPVTQFWAVPTYMIEGDPERGIEPMMPGVESVFDMAEYWELFRDPENPDKGRFYSCIPGWQCEVTNAYKMEAYGLDEYYSLFTPGSDTALATSLISAYERGDPWFGYYWQPTWVLATVDVTPLAEPPYDEDLWNAENLYACEYPREDNQIVAATSLRERAPDVRDFLFEFNIPLEVINDMLLHLVDTGDDAPDAVDWFLTGYEDIWTSWVSDDVAGRVKSAM